MGSRSFESSLPPHIQQQIDACCQAFERAWKEGGTPNLEEFMAKISLPGRKILLQELILLERHYRRNSDGTLLSDSQLCALHTDLMPGFAELLKALHRGRTVDEEDSPKTDVQLARGQEGEPTIAHEPKSTGSRALHIRCPHCTNPVELLSDTILESITCRTCGSNFSLVGGEEQTRLSPTLKSIGRFELVSRLGIGGFGTVWKARDTELDRTVAVKIPRKGQLGREEVEQFLREARSAAQLRHPNIVPVHEVGRDGDTVFIVSDLIRGVSMSDWLTGPPPNLQETAQVLATVADALHHAHQKGVIHRDLKPSNILLDEIGAPHVMDFGLAKREVGEITMTVEGHILGTPAYMSPEQAAGEGHWTDRRTDIYSLGVILFRMLTGELPFRGNAQMQIHQRLTEDPPDPRTLNRYLPRDLCTICLKCMERDPNGRYTNIKEVAEEFGRFLRHEPILARPISRMERVARWTKRKPALASAIVLTVFFAVAGPIAAVVFHRQQTRLQARIVENDNLVNRYRNDTLQANGEIETLRSQLGVWEGKTNPWEFWLWPPKADQPPRRKMIADVLNQVSSKLANLLGEGKYGLEETAHGYLGLAALADAAGRSSDAIGYYQQARDKLVTLHRQQPNETRFARALAESHARLAQLTHDTDSVTATKELESAQAIYRRLATEHKTNPVYQVDWLETELDSAMRADKGSRDKSLERVKEIDQTLNGNWPTEPVALYRLASYLTEKEPILLAPEVADSANSGQQGTTTTTD